MFFINRYESKDGDIRILTVAQAQDANEAIALQQVYLRRKEIGITYMIETRNEYTAQVEENTSRIAREFGCQG